MINETGKKTTNTRITMLGRQTAALLLPVAFSACFHYALVPVADAPVGKDVRLSLTDEGYAHLRDSIGDQFPRLHRTVEGPLIARDDNRLIVGLSIQSDGSASRELQQRVSIPRAGVLGIERKVLDRQNTGILAAGAGVVLGMFIFHWVSGEFGGTTHPIPEQGPGENIQVRFRFPL